MRDTKRKEIFHKEQSDTQTARRNNNLYQSRFKKLKAFKIILIILFAVSYFLYSPLLLFICAAYAMLLFYARSIERAANRHLPKKLHISIMKFDSVIAMFLLIITVVSVTVISLSDDTQTSMFANKTESEIRAEFKENGMSDSQIDDMLKRMKAVENVAAETEDDSSEVTDNLFTLCVGKWVFFQQESGSSLFSASSPGGQSGSFSGRGGGGFGGGKFSGERPSGDFQMPEGFSPPSGDMGPRSGGGNFISRSGKSGVISLASDVPFTEAFSQAMMAVNSLLLMALFVIGFLSMKVRYKK